MNRDKTLLSILGLLLTISLLSACGPSQAELDATASQAAAVMFATQTAEAPTSTPIPTSTPTPTKIPTATPTPQPDPNAMLGWKLLELPSTFIAISPDGYGTGSGDEAFTINLGDGTQKTYLIENSFVFFDEERFEFVFGYTALFPTKSDQDVFDALVQQLPKPGNVLPLNELEQLPIEDIGDSSAGVTGIIDAGRRMDHVRFRVGDIGAFVFIRYPDGQSPSIAVNHLAQVYAHSIANPPPWCSLVSITAVEGATWPSFDYRAEGFYPGEPRVIMLEGDLQISGGTISVVTTLLGQTGETADSDGRVEGNVTFGEVEILDATLPLEFTFSMQGVYSECEINQIVAWPGE